MKHIRMEGRRSSQEGRQCCAGREDGRRKVVASLTPKHRGDPRSNPEPERVASDGSVPERTREEEVIRNWKARDSRIEEEVGGPEMGKEGGGIEGFGGRLCVPLGSKSSVDGLDS